MNNYDDRASIDQLRERVARIEEREMLREMDFEDFYLYNSELSKTAIALFLIGSIFVLVVTGRPILTIIVAFICGAGFVYARADEGDLRRMILRNHRRSRF